MLRHIIAASSIALLFFTTSAYAAFVETDWKASGDKLATLDTKTGLEWLDLSQTRNKSISEVLLQLGHGGQYAGWRLPTASEVELMFSNFMEPYPFDDYTPGVLGFSPTYGLYNHTNMHNYTANARSYATTFENLFGRAYYKIEDYRFGYQTRGTYLDDDGVVRISGMLREHRTWSKEHVQTIWAGVSTSWTLASKATYTSVWLVSDGGVTLSSINDPSINIGTEPGNSTSAPEQPPSTVDVPSPFLGASTALMFLMLYLRSPFKKKAQ